MAMENGGLSASDAMLLGSNGGLGGLGGFGGIIGLLAVLGMINGDGIFGNGNRNWGYQPQYATQQDVQFTSQFGQILDGNRDILAQISNSTAQSVAATNQTFHDTISVLSDKYSELARDIAALAVTQTQAMANQNQCCCDIKQLIQAVAANTDAQIAQAKYENAMNLAGFEQRLNSKIDANTIQELRDKLGAVQDQLNMAGVIRFPNSWTFGAGPFPPFYGCGNNV